MSFNSKYYLYKKQNFDPNFGIISKYKSLYYTSDYNIKHKSKEGIALWHDENKKIRIVKIFDSLYDDLVWYDDKKEIINRTYKYKIVHDIHKEIAENKIDEKILNAYKKHIESLIDEEIRNLIKHILEDPQSDYYLPTNMFEDKH